MGQALGCQAKASLTCVPTEDVTMYKYLAPHQQYDEAGESEARDRSALIDRMPADPEIQAIYGLK
jgi:hypothetical protein